MPFVGEPGDLDTVLVMSDHVPDPSRYRLDSKGAKIVTGLFATTSPHGKEGERNMGNIMTTITCTLINSRTRCLLIDVRFARRDSSCLAA